MSDPTPDEADAFDLGELATLACKLLASKRGLKGIHVAVMLARYPSMAAAATCSAHEFTDWLRRHLELTTGPDAAEGEVVIDGKIHPIILKTRDPNV